MSESFTYSKAGAFSVYLYIGIILPCVYSIAQFAVKYKGQTFLKFQDKTCAKQRNTQKNDSFIDILYKVVLYYLYWPVC